MKIRKPLTLVVILIISLFSFSLQSVHATENEESEDIEVEEHIIEEDTSDEKTITEEEDADTNESADTQRNSNSEDAEETKEELKEEPSSEEVAEEQIEEESNSLQTTSADTPTYENGDKGQHVVELKEKLVQLGFASWNPPSNSYGPITTGVVEDFQDYYDLPVTGIADETTRVKIDEVLRPPYEDGDRGEPIVELKEKLVQLGFATWSNPSQFYGSYTMEAVNDFQSHYGFNEPGIVTQEMLNKMDEVLSGQYQDGDRGEHVVELKEKLVQLGFASWNPPSNSYGPITAGVVEDFQDYYDLPVTGIADEATRVKIDEVLSPPYEDGDRGEPIVELKEKLVQLGFATWSNPSQFYGSYTMEAVNDFQSHYGFSEPGIVTQEMLNKMDEVLSGQYQDGDRGEHVVELKEKLVQLGFASWNPPSNSYGPITAGVVEDFQDYYDLPVTGIADEATRVKIDEVLSPPYEDGDRGEPIVDLKEKLVQLGFATWSNPSQFYGSYTIEAVNDFQSHYGFNEPGIVTQEMLNKMDEVLSGQYQDGDRGEHVVELKEKLVQLGFASWNSPSNSYGSITAGVVEDFQDYYDLPVTGIADEVTRSRIDEILNPPYQEGDRGQPIVELKEKFVQLGFASWTNPSQFYDSSKIKTVEDFQEYYNLPVTGIADEETLTKIDEVLSPPYQDGDRGQPIVELKEKLVELGFANWSNPSQFYGSNTEKAVKKFQWYYGLEENGVVDESILALLDEAISGDVIRYKDGDRGSHVVEMKEKLVELGFANWTSPSSSYGSITASRVEDFQAYYGLPVTGVADITTLNKMNDIINGPYTIGDRGSHVVELKEKLVTLGFANWSSPSPAYGEITSGVVKDFQEVYGLKVSGIADEVTISKIQEILTSNRYSRYNLTLDQAVEIQMKLDNPAPQTDKRYAYVSASYINENNEVTASSLNVRTGPGTSSKRVGSLSYGTEVSIISEVNGWYQIHYTGAGWVDAARSDVKYYLDPNNFLDNERQRFQFLDLSRTTDADGTLLNEYLEGKGILQGKGKSFKEASRIHEVNDIYLLSHALLETGHGGSALANGVDVGKDSSGNLKLVNADNRSSLTDIRTTYNMYGIGAVDNNAHEGGAFRAYNEGWYTPETAIIGGAQFIGNSYVKSGQNTLYKMRWNPDAMAANGAASHQYATDIGWASKQVNSMYSLYQEIGILNIYLDIPEYLK